MAVTVTFDKTGTGANAFGQHFSNGHRKTVSGTFSFDDSYPTGGESITDITSKFKNFKGCVMESPLFSAGTGKHVRIDVTNKKAMLYTNAATPAEVANASDQSGATGLKFFAWGD